MNASFETLSGIIRSRRSVFPNQYRQGDIPDELIYKILENATWAPTHKKTQPWRFFVLKQDHLQKLSDFLGSFYKKMNPGNQFSELKWKKASEKPLQSSCVIALCVHRSPVELIPEWEETAALTCSVQNMWLSCASLEIGAYWSTPEAIKEIGEFLNLKKNEECLGLFYMGWLKDSLPSSERKAVDEVSVFLK